MSRYHINFDRLINMLTPSYLRNRTFVLLLQSFVFPLQSKNEEFVSFTKEHQIDAYMTSQVFYFTWYLNRRFSKYFVDKDDSIEITDPIDVGVPIYRKADPNLKPCTIWYVDDNWGGVSGTDEEPKPFYYRTENKTINETSFTVEVPRINIPQEEFVAMISAVVSTYKIAGKTFRIKISTE